MPTVYVRWLENREVVTAIDVGRPSRTNHWTFMRGLLRNLNEHCFVDDSEVHDLWLETECNGPVGDGLCYQPKGHDGPCRE